MGAKETILYIFGVLLVVVIIAVLVRIHFIIEQQGVQISILLKHEKEGFSHWDRIVRQQNLVGQPQNLLAEDVQKKYISDAKHLSSANTRAMRPCHALSQKQLDSYSGIAAHSETAQKLGITTQDSMGTGGNLKDVNFVTATNYVSTEDSPAVDQSPIINTDKTNNDELTEQSKVEQFTGNLRKVPNFLGSFTAGVKQANESSKMRFRETHRGQHKF